MIPKEKEMEECIILKFSKGIYIKFCLLNNSEQYEMETSTINLLNQFFN